MKQGARTAIGIAYGDWLRVRGFLVGVVRLRSFIDVL
jgi:hypothetical protein